MKVIKTLGRPDGWRHGAKLIQFERPIRLQVDGKTRQATRGVLSMGMVYPVNRHEQIIGDPIQLESKINHDVEPTAQG
jgi:hypothetical protein